MKRLLSILLLLTVITAFSCSDNAVKQWVYSQGLWDTLNAQGNGDAYNPEVVMDDKGNVLVAWIQYDYDGNYQLYKAEYRDGVWSKPATLSDFFNPDSGSSDWIWHRVAMNAKGDAIIVWIQTDSEGDPVVFKSEFRDGVWTHPADNEDRFSPAGQDCWQEDVAMDDNGNIIVVWRQDDGSGNQHLYVREYRDGSWSAVPTLVTDAFSPLEADPDLKMRPQIAMNNNGNAIITWVQSDGTNDQVYIREYKNGSWSAIPTLLTDQFSTTGEDVYKVEPAIDNSDNIVVAWTQYDGSNTLVYMREYRNGAWSDKPVLADGHFSPNGEDVKHLDVAMDDLGTAIVAWSQYDLDGYYRMYMREYRSGVWSAIPTLDKIAYPSAVDGMISPWVYEDDSCDYQHNISMDGKGNAIIAYQVGYAQDLIYFSWYHDEMWNHPALQDWINSVDYSYDSDYNYRPMSAMSKSGDAFIVWYGYDQAQEYSIYFAHYRDVKDSE